MAFRNAYDGYRTANVEVIGSAKTVWNRTLNSEKYNLPFILLADPGLSLLKLMIVWHEKQQFCNTYMGVVRTTYVVDEAGTIIKVFPRKT